MDMTHLKPRDSVTRLLGGVVPMPMRVIKIDKQLVYCAHAEFSVQVAIRRDLVWTFDRKTGAEVDHGLRWGPEYRRTDSYLVNDGNGPDTNCSKPGRSAVSTTHHAAAVTAGEASYVRRMTPNENGPRRKFKIFSLDKPIEGLDEEYRQARESYVLKVAEELLGIAGRMISGSKSGYHRANPDNLPIFNANVCTDDGKIWFGDLDLTLDEQKLVELARTLRVKVYVLPERAGRFHGRDEDPELGAAEVAFSSVGRVETVPSIERWEDGRLHPRREPSQEK